MHEILVLHLLLNIGKYAYYLQRNQSKNLVNPNNGCVVVRMPHTRLWERERENLANT